MSPVMDETAGDLPVRDVGLMRGGLMPTIPDSIRDVKSWKKHHLVKTKADPQRLFRFAREHLEDLCLRLEGENSVLRQHTRTQEHRLRRMSTRLLRIRQAPTGSSGMKEREMEDTIQELEARVVMLESQKGTLQNKLSLAKQHILDLGTRTHHPLSKGKSLEVEGGVRRAAQTAPPRYGHALEDTRAEMERLRSTMAEQVRMAELELTAQALRDSLREKEKEMEGTVLEMKKHQAERHRITIRENVDLIRLQKQLSDKSAALRVSQEKFTGLQEAFESQLEESQRSLRESQGALLEKVEELTQQLKQESQRSLDLEGQIGTTALSLQSLDKLQERISDVEGERDLIKDNYDALLERTLSAPQCSHESQTEKRRDVEHKREDVEIQIDVRRLEEMLQAEKEERTKLEAEKENLEHKLEKLEEHRTQEQQVNGWVTNKEKHLEQEVLHYREQVSILQERLDSVTKEFDMSVEDLSETLLQIKAFRLKQESIESLRFLSAGGNLDDPTRELVNIQASHAETVLELQKTRNLLQLEHQITRDLQDELYTIKKKEEKEKLDNQKKMTDKDQLLSKRALQINTLQAQLKELAYNPRNYKRTIPIQYTWPSPNEEVVDSTEDDVSSQLRAGESLLEIHLKAAAFTPTGLHIMSRICSGRDREDDIVTFFTYSLLDFEVHSTPLVPGSTPNYGFTSRYALTTRDLSRLGGQGSRVKVELHQSLGGVRFVTHGGGQMLLRSAMESRGERVGGRSNITGPEGEVVGVLDFWLRLFPSAEPLNNIQGNVSDRNLESSRGPEQMLLGWDNSGNEKLHDYGGGIPNELLIMLERCVGLNTRWPGLYPDAYLTYRFYDLPPHVSQTAQCSADPVFNDATSYPLAVTSDVLHYLRSSSLWVYVYDDSDDQLPTSYLAKTPIPLRALSTGKEIRGDYVLRDAAGGPRGMVRIMIRWKYPFQPVATLMGRRGQADEQDGELEGLEDEVRREEEDVESSRKPVAKPRVKTQRPEPKERQRVQRGADAWALPSPVENVRWKGVTAVRPRETPPSTERKRLTTRDPKKSSSNKSSEVQSTPVRRSSTSDNRTQDLLSLDHVSSIEDLEEEKGDDSDDSSSSQDDIIIVPPKRKPKTGEKLRVEILSLTLEPKSHVAKDKSVQRVYVEYRLLGVPMETTETPVSLRKPKKGEEIHYNFTRVIYVDGLHSASLRHYLYTMLEGTDPNQGRLKFTVVSEPMDDDDECVDVGQAFLNLKELLLTGNDVIERQIDIFSVDEKQEVIGNLKVSLEAAKALSGIYQEFHQKETEEEDEEEDGSEQEEEEEDESEEDEEVSKKEKNNDPVQLIDYDSDVF